MKLSNLLDMELLQNHLRMGVVSRVLHPEHRNLAIYNYTPVAQHDNIWDNVTEQCRGLIVDSDTDNVIARPFRKFFNLNTSFRPETHEANLPPGKPEVFEKVDGSLGILYWYNGKPSISTRGSFASDQAKWATTWFRENVWRQTNHFLEGYTPLFEIIYKENRIVVDYGDFEGLVLLGLVSVETGFEVPFQVIQQQAAANNIIAIRQYDKSLVEAKETNDKNFEGYVLSYWPEKAPVPLRIKVKTEEYVRLHKVVTGLNPKGIWEHLMAGGNPDALWMPYNAHPTFNKWCIGWIRTFQDLYAKALSEATTAFGKVAISALRELGGQKAQHDPRAIRKVWAMAIQQEPSILHSVLFSCLSGQDYSTEIWKLLEPKIEGKEAYIRNADEFNGL